MFTRKDAAESLLNYFCNEPEPLTSLTHLFTFMEPDGIIVHCFTVRFPDEDVIVSVYRDNDGVNITIW